MKTAIMQPYLFPYLGYFQLVHSVDTFVFYDDVNFIKRGWVNRNNFLIHGNKKLLSFPCEKSSQNKKINELSFNTQHPDYLKNIKTLKESYKKAPYFSVVIPLIERVLTSEKTKVSEITALSISEIAQYLDMNVEFKFSSEFFSESEHLDKAERLIAICKKLDSKTYINPIGGKELYSKETFKNEGIDFYFIKNHLPSYSQFKNEFIPGLSMIDVLMFNPKEQVKNYLTEYSFI